MPDMLIIIILIFGLFGLIGCLIHGFGDNHSFLKKLSLIIFLIMFGLSFWYFSTKRPIIIEVVTPLEINNAQYIPFGGEMVNITKKFGRFLTKEECVELTLYPSEVWANGIFFISSFTPSYKIVKIQLEATSK
jgi:hypothetical protein